MAESSLPLSGSLRRYSTEQLVDELARRRCEQTPVRPQHWCDDCAHFVAWGDVERADPLLQMPEGFNPCTKAHKMSFRTPVDFSEDWGFYRRGCGDRSTVSPQAGVPQSEGEMAEERSE
jgi:hypothetical protein